MHSVNYSKDFINSYDGSFVQSNLKNLYGGCGRSFSIYFNHFDCSSRQVIPSESLAVDCGLAFFGGKGIPLSAEYRNKNLGSLVISLAHSYVNSSDFLVVQGSYPLFGYHLQYTYLGKSQGSDSNIYEMHRFDFTWEDPKASLPVGGLLNTSTWYTAGSRFPWRQVGI